MTETKMIANFQHLSSSRSCFMLRASAVAVGLSIFIATSAAAVEIRLRSSAACATPIVRLSDVAEVFADDPRLAQSLADIPLGPAPPAKGQRSLTQNDVRQLLTLSGASREAANVTGSEAVTITADSSDRTAAMPRRPMVATGLRQAAFEAVAATERKPQPPRSGARVTTRYDQASAPAETNMANFDADRPAKAIPLVERGATVTVHARTAGIRVTATGKALEPGAAGETISVEMADTKQKVMARVVSPQVVEVAVGGSNTAISAAKPSTGRTNNP
jgi:hypothetical protein